jgi:peptidyl-prolyl cis-trans isomerase SurA
MRKQIADTPTGSASAPFKSGDKLRMLVVCARDTAGGTLPSREEISDRLVDQELAMLSQRYLRNLRREAAIVRR